MLFYVYGSVNEDFMILKLPLSLFYLMGCLYIALKWSLVSKYFQSNNFYKLFCSKEFEY